MKKKIKNDMTLMMKITLYLAFNYDVFLSLFVKSLTVGRLVFQHNYEHEYLKASSIMPA